MKKIALIILLMFCVVTMCPAQTIRNSNNSVVAKMDSDGTVRNSNNHVIGYAKGVPARYAAIYFFFNFLE